jgi:hypothetical protein
MTTDASVKRRPCRETDGSRSEPPFARVACALRQRRRMKNESHEDLLKRLSEKSVEKHFDAYADVAWDAPENRIDQHDPRFILEDGLGTTDWYRRLSPAVQAELGLSMLVNQMKVGLQFENVLTRGLLEFALREPDHSPAFRYAYHEVIEESQHTLMFQEFINRAGVSVRGLTGFHAFMARWVPQLGRSFPEMFFMFVLAGEGPIDFVQRRELARTKERHPLVERIMRIHVLEEARHICFAESFLRERVPKLSAWSMFHLRLRTPLVLWQMAKLMMEPPPAIVARFGIPPLVLREAFGSYAHRVNVLDGLAKIRDLSVDLRIVGPGSAWLWQRLGIWPSSPRLLPAGG